jgi:hypothetical protein
LESGNRTCGKVDCEIDVKANIDFETVTLKQDVLSSLNGEMSLLNGFDPNIMINNDFFMIAKHVIRNYEITKITIGPDFLDPYNLCLYDYSIKKKRLFRTDKLRETKKPIFDVGDNIQFTKDKLIMYDYCRILMDDTQVNKFSINLDNFIFSDDDSTLASKDYRIIIKDFTGDVPNHILLHLSTVALMLLSGNCEQSMAYDYINIIMRKYGKVEFTFQFNGYLHIKIGEIPKYNYKASTVLNKYSKT